MPNATYVQSTFAGGLWSQFAQGRFHDRRYAQAMNVCLNGMILETENWVRRPGTRWAMPTRGGDPGRVIKFDFEEETPPYTMVFTDGALQFLSGLDPVTLNDSVHVGNITTDNPAVMLLATPVSWINGAQGFVVGATNNPLIENRLLTLTRINAQRFSLADTITGDPIDGSTLNPVAVGAQFNRTRTFTTPYAGTSWQSLRAVQSDANGTPVSFLLQGSYKPYAVSVTMQPNAAQFATFKFAAANFEDGPYLDPLTNGTQLTASALTGIISLTISFPAYDSAKSYAAGDFVSYSSHNYESLVDENVGNQPDTHPADWAATNGNAAINGGVGFLQSDIGRLVRLFSEPPDYSSSTTYASGAIVSYNPSGDPNATTYWSSLVGSNVGNTPGTDTTNWQLLQQGGNNSPTLWTWGKITALLNFIPANPTGIAHIGDAPVNLADAFDGVLSKDSGSCASIVLSSAPDTAYFSGSVSMSIGQNYSGCVTTSYKVQSATIFPSTDRGISYFQANGNNEDYQIVGTASLYGSNVAPTFETDGILLGSAVFESQQTSNGDGTGDTFSVGGSSAATIPSSDTTNAYSYLWVVIGQSVVSTPGTGPTPSITGSGSGIIGKVNTTIQALYACQVEFVAVPGSATSDNGITVSLSGPALLYSSTIKDWRLGLYSDSTGWPTVGTWTDGRLWIGGYLPNRFDACVSNGVTVDSAGVTANFAPTDQYGNVLDSSAISYRMDLPESNPFLWMLPDQQGIIFGTKSREGLIFPPGGGGFTPTNIDARMTTRIGGYDAEPQRTDHTISFIQKYQREVVEYFADVFSGKFTAPNLIKDAKKLTQGNLQELAYQQEFTSTIWGRVNGSLIGCTYIRDTLMTSSGPTINAWHEHSLGSGRTVESICTGSSINGNLDALTLVTTDGAAVYVEILGDILDEGSLQSEACYLDCAIVPTSTAAVDISTGFPYGGLQLNGLWPLEGKTVTAWLGGLDCGDYKVSGGCIQVPYGDGIGSALGSFPTATNRYDQGLFTLAFVESGTTANGAQMFNGRMPMFVGFTYNSDGQLLRPIAPADTGSRNGPAFGKLARDHYLMGLFEGTVGGGGGLHLGTDFNTLESAIFKQADGVTTLTVDTQFSGVFRDQFESSYDFDAMPCWRISRPQILNVQAFGAARETADV